MSENKPHPEADAVLSTVRRIVTRSMTDPTIRTADAAGSDAPSEGEYRSERLLLTPALRVNESEADDPAPELPPRRRPRVTTRTLTAERITLEQRIAELEKAVSDDGTWEPDGSEEVDTETPRQFPFAYRPSEDEIEDATIVPEPLLEAQRAEAVILHSVPEPDAKPEPKSDVSAGLVPEHEDPDLQAEPDITPVPFRIRAEPEGEAAAPDSAPAVEIPASAPLVDEDDLPDDDARDLVEESVIDEDMLRDIVAEIVRQELQGELGERITRNVRKLVRREIHRAIMTRDFG